MFEDFRQFFWIAIYRPHKAFIHTKALESSVTEAELEQKYSQTGDFRFQNSSGRVNTEGCALGNSLSGCSNQDDVILQNEYNESERRLFNNSNEIKCEQVDTDSLVSNDDAVNNGIKVDRNDEECFFNEPVNNIKCESEIQMDTGLVSNVDHVKIEEMKAQKEKFFLPNDSQHVKNDRCDGFESNIFSPMEAEKDQDQAASNKCYEIKVDRDEEEDVSFNSPGHTTNTDGNQVTDYDHEMSTDLYSNQQEKLADRRPGPSGHEMMKYLWENPDISKYTSCHNQQTLGLSYDKRIDSETKDELDHKTGIQAGDETVDFSKCHNVSTENVGLVNQNEKDTCTDYVEAFNHNGHHTIQKPYNCTVCGKAFTGNFYLTVHMRYHTVERPYKCTVCDYTFSQKSHLTSHIRCHTGDKPYKCTVCDKAFTENSSLTRHMRCHTGEKPYKCFVCVKVFKHNSDLARHVRCHTIENLHKCTVCDKTFTQMSCLTSHMRHHTGEKPYKCAVCDKTFKHHSSCARHMRCHIKESHYICAVCDKTFTKSSDLTNHEAPYRRKTL